jgi:hypothetical protein
MALSFSNFLRSLEIKTSRLPPTMTPSAISSVSAGDAEASFFFLGTEIAHAREPDQQQADTGDSNKP